MPSTVKVSLWLFFLSVAVSALTVKFIPVPMLIRRTNVDWLVWTVVVLAALPILAVWFFIVYRAYHRSNWARWVLALLCVLSLAGYVPWLSLILRQPTLADLLHFLGVIANLGSVVLLFLPLSNEWYRRRDEAAAT